MGSEKMTDIQGTYKIDIFTHILPPKYKEALDKKSKYSFYQEINRPVTPLFDLNARFRIMDKYEGVKQVLSVASPPLEMVVDVSNAIDLAKMANDELAELIAKYPDRFVAAIACLPMSNMDAALVEVDRAVIDLNFKGVQVYTSINGRPLDSPEFMALYDKMCKYDLPIWIHPVRDRASPDYPGESHSRYGLFWAIGWPYETTLAMCRLVFSGVLEKYGNIKFIAHHCGAMLPFFAKRIGAQPKEWLSRVPIEYFQMFFGDTATVASVPSLMCGYAFFGADHMVFGTDMPYTGVEGIGETISALELMDISTSDKKKIFGENAKRLLKLLA